MMDKKMKLMMMLSKKNSMMDDMEYGMEDESGGFEREGMRIAAADLIQAIRSGNEVSCMDALEAFISMCKKG